MWMTDNNDFLTIYGYCASLLNSNSGYQRKQIVPQNLTKYLLLGSKCCNVLWASIQSKGKVKSAFGPIGSSGHSSYWFL